MRLIIGLLCALYVVASYFFFTFVCIRNAIFDIL